MRINELAKIHIAKKDLCLDDDTYRDILWTLFRKRSASDLDSQARFKLIAHFKKLGWKATPKTKRKIEDPKAGKIWSLWYQLKDAGLVESVTPKAIRAYVKKQTNCDDIRFCTEDQKSHVIECLKQWLARSK